MKLEKRILSGILSAVMAATILPFSAIANQLETNLSLGEGVVVSSSSQDSSNVRTNAFDGNLSTRWASKQTSTTEPQEERLKIDLGKDMVVDEVRIKFELAAQEYKVILTKDSEDPSGEYTVKHEGIRQGEKIDDVIETNGVEARYIEFVGIKQALFTNDSKPYTPWGYSIYEMEVIQFTDDEDITAIRDAIGALDLQNKYYSGDQLPLHDEQRGVTFEWTSDDVEITEEGLVVFEGLTQEKEVNLTLTASKNGKELSESFVVVISPTLLTDEEYVQKAYDMLTFRKHILNDLKLETTVFEGLEQVEVAWSTDSEFMEVQGDNLLIKEHDGNVDAQLKATLTKGTASQEKVFDVILVAQEQVDVGVFPKPHSAYRLNGELNLSQVNVISLIGENDVIDAHLDDVLSTNSITEDTGSQVKLVLATVEQKDEISQYLSEDEYSVENSVANIDGYILKVDPASHVVLLYGRDDSAVYNAITTLKFLLEGKDQVLDGVMIEDYADVEYRGYIEGFYGSWSEEQRISLLNNLSDSKMNTYIYGSKSDPYHRNKWRELYPESDPSAIMDMDRIRELVQVAEQNNMEFVWGAHAAGIDFSNSSEYDALVAKYNQLYDAGVRQFAIFFDDGGTDFTNAATFINKLNREYIQTKEGLKPLIYCPQGYNYRFANQKEWNEIKKFDEDVNVMFTGTTTMSEINQSVLDRIEETIDHTPYIWWNYPVNDLDMNKQLVVGPLIGLDTDVEYLPGLASNPMFQAEASRVALHSIGDYLWNIKEFDAYASWDNAIALIIEDPAVQEAFKTFALNVSVMGKQEFAYISEESEYLKDTLDTIIVKYRNGENCTQEVALLKEEIIKIQDAIQVLKNAQDTEPELIGEIDKWLTKGEKVCDWMMSTLTLVEDYDGGEYTQAEKDAIGDRPAQIRANIDNCNGSNKDNANFGQYRLLPFIYDMTHAIEAKIDGGISLFGSMMIKGDTLFDGNVDTKEYAYGVNTAQLGYMRAGLYFGVDLNQMKVLNSITLDVHKMASGTVEVSQDMVSWEKVGEINDQQTHFVFEELNKEARYIRVVNHTNQEPAIEIAEIHVEGMDIDKSSLEQVIERAKAVDPSGYTPASVEAMNEALRQAENVFANSNSTQQMVNDATQALENALENLVPGCVKSRLQELYDYALEQDTENLVPAVKEEFDAVMAKAAAVLEDKNATQEQVNDAILELVRVLRYLDMVAGDKTLLNALVAEADTMMTEADKYVKTNWQKLVDAQAKAKSVQANENALTDEVETAVDELLEAMKLQRYKAEKSNLEDLINKAEDIDLSGYSAESVAVFRSALAEAKVVMANENLSEDDQAIVDAAVDKLSTAMDGLTAEGEVHPTDKPESTDKPEATDQPQSTQKPGEDNVPQTGDTHQITLYSLILVFTTIGLFVLTLKKRSR